MTPLALYLAAAQLAWYAKTPIGEIRAGEEIAEATAQVARELHKTPLEALERFSIAWEESGAVWGRIIRGECKTGECDGGKAFGPWQIHADEQGGIVLVGGRFTYVKAVGLDWANAHPGDIYNGERLSADPVAGARVAFALRIAQWSRGRQGVARARAYWATHPFTWE